jgi:hypothetical protein
MSCDRESPHLVLVARTLVWKELGLEKPMEILWVVTLL